nr:uncharacterized protein LOC107428940 [Ziziphus jujuba var. spinosa]
MASILIEVLYLFESDMKTSKVFLFINIFLCLLCSSQALDTIKPGMTLHSDETLISAGGVFELGFFTPSKSTHEHLGIWFKNDRNKKPVWVALREISFIKSTGFLTIQYDGNLVISDILTVTNIINSGALAASNETSAKILDTGNLILMERGKTIWQSFDNPTDTLLPGMSLGWFNMNTDRFRMRHLTSWLNPSDPNNGDYSLGIDPSNMTKFNVWRKDAYQQIGFWDGHIFRFFFQSSLANHYNISFESNSKDSYLTFNRAGSNILSWFVLESDGFIKEFKMVGEEISSVNHSLCDATLPRNSTGCLALTPMTCKDEDYFTDIRGFIPNSRVVIWPASSDAGDCELMCRSNCSCVGYVFLVDNGTGCKLYYGNKDDLLKNIGRGNNTVYVRGDASKSDHRKKRNLVLIIIALPTPLILIILIKFRNKVHCLGIKGRPGGMQEVQTSLAFQLRTNSDQNRGVIEFSINKDHELPLVSFSSVMAATDNFSIWNKIGEGGFGPVYKGKLQGHNIAVKKLSKHSRQGLTEFKNELQLLYRVQHRNLVKLLGCCIEQEEKILIYEYMANTSLDSFIFDPVRQSLLDWRKRKHIIEGIAQGLLYLHKYSRLRIIHRDLKTSNILLDNCMNPKISDFGLARILFENECQTKTMRVVGTYGYMSPEYAIHGLYSIKSDVFSFGVILLEIVSGRKNATFDVGNRSLNLLGYAWDTWAGGRCMELMDPSMDATCSVDDIMLCIQVGLLCVQESAADRPTMSDVVAMFSNERMSLPKPKQPAFYTVLYAADGSLSTPSQNIVTISTACIFYSSKCSRWFNLQKAKLFSKSCNNLGNRSTITTLNFYGQSDTLKPGEILHSNETLISSAGVFELGFFTSSKSDSQYLGIWFKNDRNKKPVWVANRENPLGYATGILRIWYDGNLVLNDARTIPITVNNGAAATSNETSAKLLDSGNFMLTEGQKIIWQSFDYPTDTFLPGMNLGWFNIDTDDPRKLHLSSWLSPSDPSRGLYSLGLDGSDKTKFRVWRRGGAYQQIGFWDGHVFRFFFQSSLDNYQNFSFVSNSKDIYLTLNNKESNIISWLVLASDGLINDFRMVGQDISSVNYSLCDATLPHNSTGCLVLTPSMCKDGDNFSDIKGLIPNSMVVTWEGRMGRSDCELICKSNCSCVAYASSDDNDGTECELLYGNKADLLNNKGRGNNTIYVREDASDSDPERTRKVLLIITIVLTPLVLIFMAKFLYGLWRRFDSSGNNGSPGGMTEGQTAITAQLGTNNDPSRADVIELGTKDHELPLLSFSSVVAATDSFSVQNKLGEGGFGPVYKGKLHGHDIAVKRLSKNSGQGSVEFKNEVQLISKLQHTNLVKLLGCCIEHEEKILIYEYMANKSLDSFIFDPVKQPLLDWRKRKHIIEGIAQGLLYLHKYSRVRIIHRDLKTSNILLDNSMNPKISDFGMARILFESESRPETKRIAGTYGYMSPEYAVHGFYSTKSDVFSFGVIVLEIMSGRKNANFYEPNCSLNLLGYAWELWNGERWMKLIDPTLDNSSLYDTKLCIQVGLLCVQENADDRPTMSDVVSILSNEGMSLPTPKQPAYSTILNAAASSTSGRHTPTHNLASVSLVEAR